MPRQVELKHEAAMQSLPPMRAHRRYVSGRVGHQCIVKAGLRDTVKAVLLGGPVELAKRLL
jgi:hypothetical protein